MSESKTRVLGTSPKKNLSNIQNQKPVLNRWSKFVHMKDPNGDSNGSDNKDNMYNNEECEFVKNLPISTPWFFHSSPYPLDNPTVLGVQPTAITDPNAVAHSILIDAQNKYENSKQNISIKKFNSNYYSTNTDTNKDCFMSKELISSAANSVIKWFPFSPDDNSRLEKTYQEYEANKNSTTMTEKNPSSPSIQANIDKQKKEQRELQHRFSQQNLESTQINPWVRLEDRKSSLSSSLKNSNSITDKNLILNKSSSAPIDTYLKNSYSPTFSDSNNATLASSPDKSVNFTLNENTNNHISDKDSDNKIKSKVVSTTVLVGVDKLYSVDITTMTLTPVYWTPLSDTAVVVRAVWFYSANLFPILPPLSLSIESAFREFQPWTDVYNIEYQTAIKFGAEAEEKLKTPIGSSKYLVFEPNKVENTTDKLPVDESKTSSNNLLKDKESKPIGEAQIVGNGIMLSSSLFYSSTVLSSILNGKTLGTKVQRSFSYANWIELNGDKTTLPNYNETTANCTQKLRERRIDQLVLVIHGIGQKLSEKKETVNFTYAVNKFRHCIDDANIHPGITSQIEKNSRVMVLPINWRRKIKPEDEPFRPTNPDLSQNNSQPPSSADPSFFSSSASIDLDSSTSQYQNINTSESRNDEVLAHLENGEDHSLPEVFKRSANLDDITVDSIPAVRSLISDVMLDIPYYLSHHRNKLLCSVVDECNRVYRLWCENNPGFKDYGSVNILGHSLGSVIAFDILSFQPTVSPPLYSQKPNSEDMLNYKTSNNDLSYEYENNNEEFNNSKNKQNIIKDSKSPQIYFEFDTKNLFFCGSPVGLFMLLNRAKFIPRNGRNKSKAYLDEWNKHNFDKTYNGVEFGEAGQYGCLAVDNIYNIYHTCDPIVYRLNAMVDLVYSQQLKYAYLPTGNSFFVYDSNESESSEKSSLYTNQDDDTIKRDKPNNSETTSFWRLFKNKQPKQKKDRKLSMHNKEYSSKRENELSSFNYMENNTSTISNNSYSNLQSTDSLSQSQANVEDLPKVVELATHDFSREHNAEENMKILNDNGQIDYAIVPSALENQYISMLSAHSSYWYNMDFARLVVLECSRKKGLLNSIPILQAKKEYSFT